MELLHTFFQKIPMAALFLSLAVGYSIGKIKMGNFSLGGMAGTLLVAAQSRALAKLSREIAQVVIDLEKDANFSSQP